jgi:hypothetical protein
MEIDAILAPALGPLCPHERTFDDASMPEARGEERKSAAPMMLDKMRAGGMRMLIFFLGVTAALIVDGYFQSASAQCVVDGKKVFIDPRLVLPRARWTPQALSEFLANQYVPEWQKKRAMEDYYNQLQPIRIPYAGGTVLISPSNPCLQQFIPK